MKDTPAERQYLDNVPREVQDLLYEGKLILAIKLTREKTGLGLKEAKEKVEAAEAEMRARFPEALPTRKAGCGGAAALVMATLLLAGVVLFGVIG